MALENVQTLKNVRYGIEIEFNVPYTTVQSDCFSDVGRDGTASRLIDRVGMEFRTPIFSEFPLALLRKTLYKFRIKGGKVKFGICGIHIHFSEILLTSEQIKTLSRLVCRNSRIWEYRKQYCLKNANNSDKFIPIRTVEIGHYECRVFNSTLNIRGVHQQFKMFQKCLEQVLCG